MCFIKNSCMGSAVLIGEEPSLQDIMAPLPFSHEHFKSSTSIDCSSYLPPPSPYFTGEAALLGKLLASVHYNSSLLMKLGQNIEQSSLLLQHAHSALQLHSLQQEAMVLDQPEGWKSREGLIQRLFGEKLYRYKLKLRHKFPSTIYKERNISLSVELLDDKQKLVMNSNMMSLCVAVCDVSGQWICENEEGESFMQGKTEVELYHGEASFLKIYPRDVSRQFENGKVDIIIYPKPSLIRFSTEAGTVEQRVDTDLIEPLLIKDVTIRAKKKTH